MILDKRGSVFYPRFDNGGDYDELIDEIESLDDYGGAAYSVDLSGSVLVLSKNPGQSVLTALSSRTYNQPLSSEDFLTLRSALGGAEGVVLGGEGAWTTLTRSEILQDYDIVFAGTCLGLNTKLQYSFLRALSFDGDDFRGVDFRNSVFIDTTFDSVNLQGADFRDCHFKNLQITDSNLRGANFEGAKFDGTVQIESNDVEGASFLGIYRSSVGPRVQFENNKGHDLSDASTTTVLVHGLTRLKKP